MFTLNQYLKLIVRVSPTNARNRCIFSASDFQYRKVTVETSLSVISFSVVEEERDLGL